MAEEQKQTEQASPATPTAAARAAPATESKKIDDNVIFVGGKPFMNYVTGVVMQFTTKGAHEVIIRSRGKFISKAVDIAEVARKRFLKDQNISVKEVKIDSEEFQNEQGKKVNVSTLDITLIKS